MKTWIRHPLRWAALNVVLLLVAHTADAQGLTMALGMGSGSGGDFAERESIAVSAAFDHGKAFAKHAALVWRVGSTATLRNGSDLGCEVRVGGGACPPAEPDLFTLHAAAGVRMGADRASLALFAGPDYYGTLNTPWDGTSGLGALWALTGHISIVRNVALGATVEQHYARYLGQTLRVSTLMFAVRLGPTMFPR
ncbi:MAG TPA: hypothetical protein DGD08_01695 [Gemmatimonas aurantiaca]|uniref:Outer membrane protein beta-barrel domain-containing protein n=2 Tax=Gemmatimonas aurantiaca TaxID=173480 RepID=C1A5I1_GEMAT|nr:hypothetical protein [Gemmatimonas aurantiaca]BAH37491.1 hypothetical protein GAU_0449 [Gemmatimonas aurantiaca T-27]HCT55906.1 hypothetical protein [Gemmatimonas aurantiaca]